MPELVEAVFLLDSLWEIIKFDAWASWWIWGLFLFTFSLRNHQIGWLSQLRRICGLFLFTFSLRNHQIGCLSSWDGFEACFSLHSLQKIIKLDAWASWGSRGDFLSKFCLRNHQIACLSQLVDLRPISFDILFKNLSNRMLEPSETDLRSVSVYILFKKSSKWITAPHAHHTGFEKPVLCRPDAEHAA